MELDDEDDNKEGDDKSLYTLLKKTTNKMELMEKAEENQNKFAKNKAKVIDDDEFDLIVELYFGNHDDLQASRAREPTCCCQNRSQLQTR